MKNININFDSDKNAYVLRFSNPNAFFGLGSFTEVLLSEYDLSELKSQLGSIDGVIRGFADDEPYEFAKGGAIRTSNSDSRKYVNEKRAFRANNLHADWFNDAYVVLSYGYYPVYVWKDGTWYENSNKYSVSTAKQMSQSRPSEPTIKKTREELNNIVGQHYFAKGGELQDYWKEYDRTIKQVKAKVATAIGIDEAVRYHNKDFVVSPYSLIIGAVDKGWIDFEEIDKNLWDEALSEANDINERYRDSGEGIGSSDMNAFIYSMLKSAGFNMGVVNHRYQRLDKKFADGGNVQKKSSERSDDNRMDNWTLDFLQKLRSKDKNVVQEAIRDLKKKNEKENNDSSKLAKGGLVAYANFDIENKLGVFYSVEAAKKFAKANKSKFKAITFEDEYGDNIVVAWNDSPEDIDWLFEGVKF